MTVLKSRQLQYEFCAPKPPQTTDFPPPAKRFFFFFPFYTPSHPPRGQNNVLLFPPMFFSIGPSEWAMHVLKQNEHMNSFPPQVVFVSSRVWSGHPRWEFFFFGMGACRVSFRAASVLYFFSTWGTDWSFKHLFVLDYSRLWEGVTICFPTPFAMATTTC